MPVSFILKKSYVPPTPKVYSTPFVDTFDGDNTSLPSCENWRSVSPGFSNFCQINNNKLNYNFGSQIGGNVTQTTATVLNHYVKGDFDIRVYQTVLGYTTGSSSPDSCANSLRLFIDDSHSMFIQRGFAWSGWVSKRVYYNIGAGLVYIDTPALNNGWYRITRTGTLWTAYFSSDGNSWTTLVSNINVGSGDLVTTQLLGTRTEAGFNTEWENFTIQSADEVISKAEYVPVRPLSSVPVSTGTYHIGTTRTYRIRFLASQIGNAGGEITKSKFSFKGLASDGPMALSDVYVGKGSISGNLWNFDSSPTQITFDDGSSSASIPDTEVKFSDEISYVVNGSEDIIVSFKLTNIGGFHYYSTGKYGLIKTGGGSWYIDGSYGGDITIPSMTEYKLNYDWAAPVLTGIWASTL